MSIKSLIREVARADRDRRAPVAALLAAARDGERPWRERCVAALLLEHQLLRLAPADLTAHVEFLGDLGLVDATGDIDGAVLAEGYTRTDPATFVAELRRRLSRLDRLHRQLEATPPREWPALLAPLARRENKITLLRYLVTADEVAARIGSQVRRSRGAAKPLDHVGPRVEAEAERAIEALPRFERALVRRLLTSGEIFWVADRTSARLNRLVEYPLTTVTLTVKPPGSDLELQLKRAGRRGDQPLTVVYERDGKRVPVSHRLDGGSTAHCLEWEARAAAHFRSLFRLVHGRDPALATAVSMRTVYDVPTGDGSSARHHLRYFTEARAHGDGFAEMRAAMHRCVARFREERGWVLTLPGALGTTLAFLNHAGPSQSLLVGTSSFRIDKLALYASDDGAAAYFDALGGTPSRLRAQRFADEILEEILGELAPPPGRFNGHGEYVERALAVPANRHRADRAFLDTTAQIGEYWGTLLALRGTSKGESFVARNVGLRSRWSDGRWRPALAFMDHDELRLWGLRSVPFAIGPSPLWKMGADEAYIFGQPGTAGTVELLETLYRAGPELKKRGRDRLRATMKRAYRRTQEAIRERPREFAPRIGEEAVRRADQWDVVVRELVRTSLPDRERVLDRKLRRLELGSEQRLALLAQLTESASLVERYAFLSEL